MGFELGEEGYSICVAEEHKIPVFATAFGVTEDIVRNYIAERQKKEAEAKRKAELAERRKEKMEEVKTFLSKVEKRRLSNPLISLLEESEEVANSLSDDDEQVSIQIMLGRNDEGEPCFVGNVSGLKASVKKSKGRTKYVYRHNGTEIDGNLKQFVIDNYGDSKAAARLSENSNLVAWVAIQGDRELKPLFSREAAS